jgi:hypothetical protein
LNKAIQLVDTQIEFVRWRIQTEQSTAVSAQNMLKKVKWTGTIIQLVELVYALHEARCFNEISLKELFAAVCKVFDCEVKNYYRLFWDIKNRTTADRTKFLNELRMVLMDKLFRMDSGKRK